MSSISVPGLRDPASDLFDPFATVVGQSIEKASDAKLPIKLATFDVICGYINHSENNAKFAARAIQKRLSIVMQAKDLPSAGLVIKILQLSLRRCSIYFRNLVIQKDFIDDLIRSIGVSYKAPPQVRELEGLLGLLQDWSDAFQPWSALEDSTEVDHDLGVKEVNFQLPNANAPSPIVIIPQRAVMTPSSSATARTLSQQIMTGTLVEVEDMVQCEGASIWFGSNMVAASKGLVTFFWYPEDREGWTILISGLDSSRYSPEIRVSDVSAFDSFMANSRAVLVLHTRSAFRSRTRVAMKMQNGEKFHIFSEDAKETGVENLICISLTSSDFVRNFRHWQQHMRLMNGDHVRTMNEEEALQRLDAAQTAKKDLACDTPRQMSSPIRAATSAFFRRKNMFINVAQLGLGVFEKEDCQLEISFTQESFKLCVTPDRPWLAGAGTCAIPFSNVRGCRYSVQDRTVMFRLAGQFAQTLTASLQDMTSCLNLQKQPQDRHTPYSKGAEVLRLLLGPENMDEKQKSELEDFLKLTGWVGMFEVSAESSAGSVFPNIFPKLGTAPSTFCSLQAPNFKVNNGDAAAPLSAVLPRHDQPNLHQSEATTSDSSRSKLLVTNHADHQQCVKLMWTDVDFISLSIEANAAVDRAFSSANSDEILSEAFRLQVAGKDLATLKYQNWLNDEIANFFLELIMKRSTLHRNLPKVHAFITFFYEKLNDKGYAGVKQWTKEIDLLSHDIILVPVHLSNHWCLAVIILRKKQIRYYDSLGHNNELCFGLLRTYLEEEKKDKGSNYPDWSNISLDWEHWDFISMADKEGIPQQQNNFDCGVFMLKFADFVSRDKAVDFKQVNMPYFRRRICWEILQKKLMGC